MEIRVKERLIGALILVALIVLLVPELLSGPHPQQRSGAQDAGAVHTYTIDLAAPAKSTPPAPAREPEAAPEESAQNSAPGTGVVSLEPAPEVAGSDSNAPPTESAAPPEDQPAPRTKTPTPPQKPAAATATDADSAWAVQLGSFASDDNAQRLVKELKAGGYKAFVSKTGSGSRARYRVRVGPEQDRARAENLAERLRREGRSAVIVSHP
jgi:DedD protein